MSPSSKRPSKSRSSASQRISKPQVSEVNDPNAIPEVSTQSEVKNQDVASVSQDSPVSQDSSTVSTPPNPGQDSPPTERISSKVDSSQDYSAEETPTQEAPRVSAEEAPAEVSSDPEMSNEAIPVEDSSTEKSSAAEVAPAEPGSSQPASLAEAEIAPAKVDASAISSSDLTHSEAPLKAIPPVKPPVRIVAKSEQSASSDEQSGKAVIQKPADSSNSLPAHSSGESSHDSSEPVSGDSPTRSDDSSADSGDSPAGDTALSMSLSMRHQPIPPPSEPKQYRAIGLIRGRYVPSEEQFTRGELIAAQDGTVINAVLLGRIMSLVKKHLDLEQDHLWVIYPRTREKETDLHAQIVGVWEPEKLNKHLFDESETGEELDSDSVFQEEGTVPEFSDGYFSIRGEVIFQSEEDNSIIVKIRQSPRKDEDQEKSFKLQLKGQLEGRVVGYFWNLHVQRQGNDLVIRGGDSIGILPPKKKSQQFKGYRKNTGPRKGPQRPTRPGTGGSRPVQPSTPTPVRKEPLPKPVIKRKSEEQS